MSERMGDDALEVLVRNRRRFMAFLVSRVGNHDAARDLLHAVSVRAIERGGDLRKEESAVAWFFRLLRHAMIDEARRHESERRTLEKLALEGSETTADELERHVCDCVAELSRTVRPEYAEIVQAVDMRGQTAAQFAAKHRLSIGNARVRLHRARKAMRDRLVSMCGTCCQKGCESCPCESTD